MEQEHYEKSVSCPHDSIHPAWCSLLVCSTWAICIHQSCICRQVPLKGHVPRLEALDLQMNQFVYTFYTCFVLHTNLIPCRPGGIWLNFQGFCLMRLESAPWAGRVWCLPWDHPLYLSNYVALFFFRFSLSHKSS